MGSENSLIQAGTGSAVDGGRLGLGVAVSVGGRMKVEVASGVSVGAGVEVDRRIPPIIQAKVNRRVEIEKNKNFNCRIFLMPESYPLSRKNGMAFTRYNHLARS